MEETMTTFSLAQNLQKKSSWIMAIGVLQVILGIFALVFVGFTSLASVIYLGLVFMISGICEVVYGIQMRKEGDLWFHLLFGALTAICGFFVFSSPVSNLIVLTMLVATLFITSGAVMLVGSMIERFASWGWFAAFGVISILAGYMVFKTPLESSTWLIGYLVGLQMIMRGCAWLRMGWVGHRLTHAYGKIASQGI
jgi:uncharacterized membrane protein HdeD (DUF308 family)